MEKNTLWQFQDDLMSKRDGKRILLQKVITFSYSISTLILFLLKRLFHREEKTGEHQKIQSWWTFNFGYYFLSQFEFLILHSNQKCSKTFQKNRIHTSNFIVISYYEITIFTSLELTLNLLHKHFEHRYLTNIFDQTESFYKNVRCLSGKLQRKMLTYQSSQF